MHLVIVLRNNAFHDVSDTSIKNFLLKNLRVKPTYIVSTIIIAVVIVIIMSPNQPVTFELCNTAIKEYYFNCNIVNVA